MFNLTDTCISLPQRECNRHKRLQPHYDLTVPMQSLLTENQVESVKNTTRTQSDRVCYRLKTRKAITRVHQLVREGHKILIFMRGCPGSGKSTLARSIATNEQIVSADNYLFGKDKKYEYNSFKVAQAHEKCFVAVRDLMETCKNPIILDNTNLSLNDMIPATLQALTFEYRIMFMEPDTFWRYDIHTLSRKTLHNVPRYKIAQMLKRFDRNITYETLVSSALRSIWNPFEYRYTSKVNMNRNAYFEKADTPVNTAIHKSIDCSYVNNETLVETVESTIDIEGTCVPIEDEIEESANLKSLTIKDTNLRDKFPDIPDHLIEHLLDLCNNDYLLAESIIKESGFTHITKQPVALAIVDSANVSNPIDKADNSSSGCDVDTKQISSNVDNTLLLTLDYNFIDKLEVLFGKIKFPLNIATTKSSNDQRAYLLPLEIYEADKLYRLLTLINRRLCNEDIYGN
ncbi:hypothetical protein GJ496_000852 [Pomphorhynchus laevis]|nr:hypothetical protein GJ496_000852 [Pomphorhynchus laevis]